MTSQDALIKYFVETSGITSPKLIAEKLRVPYETARSWMRRYRSMRCDLTGEISPPVESHRSNPTGCGEIPPVPRARTSYTGEYNNNNNNTTEPRAQDVPQSVDVDDVKLKVKLINAVQNQPMNQFAGAFENIQPIKDLIAEGYDLDAQIIPTIRKFKKTDGKPINGWGFWVAVIRSQHANPNTGKPKPVRYAQEQWEPGELVTCYVN